MSVFNVDDNTDYECYDNMTYIPRRRQYPIKSYLPNIIENDIKDYNPYFFPNDHFKRFVTCSLGKYDHPPMELMDAMRHFFQKVLDWTFLPNYDRLNDVDILDQVMNFVKNHKVLYNYGPNWFKLVAIPRDYISTQPLQQRMLSGIPTRVGPPVIPSLPVFLDDVNPNRPIMYQPNQQHIHSTHIQGLQYVPRIGNQKLQPHTWDTSSSDDDSD